MALHEPLENAETGRDDADRGEHSRLQRHG